MARFIGKIGKVTFREADPGDPIYSQGWTIGTTFVPPQLQDGTDTLEVAGPPLQEPVVQHTKCDFGNLDNKLDFADRCISRFHAGEDLSHQIWDIFEILGYDECDSWVGWVSEPTDEELREYYEERDELFSWEVEPEPEQPADSDGDDEDDWTSDDEVNHQEYDTLTEEQKDSLLDAHYGNRIEMEDYYYVELNEVKGAYGRSIWIALKIGDQGAFCGSIIRQTDDEIWDALPGHLFT
jgi:hypothetical protein